MYARVVATVVATALFASPVARAEELPKGAIGAMFGITSGTGADAKRLGYGYYQFGLQAAWHPMTTEQKASWSVRWATMFGTLYSGSAAQIEEAD